MKPSIYINATSTFLPNDPVDNDNIEKVLGLVHGQPSKAKDIVLNSNKIKTRHYAIDPVTRKPTHSNAEMGAQAVQLLFKNNPDLSMKTAQLLSCGSSSPDLIGPSHGQMVHGLLKDFSGEVLSLGGGCCSASAALKTAYLSLLAGDTTDAIVSASEAGSKFMRSELFESESEEKINELNKNPLVAFEFDFLRWMLSDGAGAFYLSNRIIPGKTNLKINWIESRSYSNETPVCMLSGGIRNPDKSVTSWTDLRVTANASDMKFVMNLSQDISLLQEKIPVYSVERPLTEIKKKRGLRPGDYTWFLPHYSSDFFRKILYETLKKVDFEIPYERWFTQLSEIGNIGSVSIFAFVDKLIQTKKLNSGDKILCYVPESARFSVCYFELEVI